jgi:hypothetical protein
MPRRTAAAVFALLLALPTLAVEVSGIQVPDTVSVASGDLRLNGAGIRKKFIVKVYVGALYLAAPSADSTAIVQSEAPKSVRMWFLRGVSRQQVMEAFQEGFRNNLGEKEAAALGPSLNRLAAVIPREVQEGQMMEVTYLPGRGTTVSLPGQGEILIEGKPFGDALLLNWLGKAPADEGLKEKMLGK